ncbi:hypothetical protein TYRP_012499 [Tyrophagus putrescentiae]|nr:hypothetical protein TYRP_012499 [Tyrophagus putrescentiae]
MLNARPRPVRSCQEHIYKLEEMIVDLLAVKDCVHLNEQLVDTYRNKVVAFWQKLECPESAAALSEWSSGGSSRSGQHNFVTQSYDGHYSFGLSGDFGRQQNKAAAVPVVRHSAHSPPPTAEAIRGALKAAFNRLPPIKSIDEDTEGMKRLLILVTKARAITMSHWKDVRLLSDIFSWAFEKLPAVQQALYCEQYNGERKWLRDLRNFIQDELHIYSLQCFADAEEQQAEEEEEEVAMVVGNCWYCKTAGHQMKRCPVLGSTLCPKCFNWSHSEQRCPNSMLFVKLEDIY